MSQPASWIHLGSIEPADLQAAALGYVRTRIDSGNRSMPMLLWGRTSSPIRFSSDVWAEPGEFAFAMLAPAHLSPGRRDRWLAWGLSPLVAAFRRLGAHAWLEGAEVRVNGTRVGCADARDIGGYTAVLGSMVPDFDFAVPEDAHEGNAARPVSGALLGFDPWLSAINREGRARRILAAFRYSVETQHGWQFDTAWPSQAEIEAIASAERELQAGLDAMTHP